MLTYLRRIDRSPQQRRPLFSNPFARRATYEERGELPGDFNERRLNRRVFNYWQERCGDECWPERESVRGEELGDDWAQCFVLDVTDDCGFPKYEYLGPGLAALSGIYLSGAAEWKQTLLDKATEQVGRAIKTGKPVLCDDLLTLYDGSRMLFRSVLLPLGPGRRITHFLGAANGRVLDEAKP